MARTLAFPFAADAIVLFSDGYAVNILAKLGWPGTLDLTYFRDGAEGFEQGPAR